MLCSVSSRRLARHRLALPISLLLTTAISSAALGQTITLVDGDSYVNSGDITDIIAADNVGTIENRAGATIGDAPGHAIEITGNVAGIINAGTILGQSDGVNIGGDIASFVNAAGGSIEGQLSGVYLNGALGGLTNAGNMEGQIFGLNVTGAVGSFANLAGGSIESAADAVVFNDGVGKFTNAGHIKGDNWATFVDGDVTSFVNATGGTIEGRYAVEIRGTVGGFTNAGSINGLETGVNLDGAVGAFTNKGHIAGDLGGLRAGGDVTSFVNASGGTIESATGYAVEVLGAVGGFANAGHIAGDQGGVFVDGEVTSFFNASGGTIESSQYGAQIVGPVSGFTNAGTITGGDQGVLFNDSVGSFINTGGITGVNLGILFNTSVGSFANAGHIAGGQGGLFVGNGVTSFVNASDGTIQSTAGRAVDLNGDVGGFANAGSITGETDGVYIANDVASFINAAGGSIAGSQGLGVLIDGAATTVINAGRIEGDQWGIYIQGDTGSFINTASGDIAGTIANGVQIQGALQSFLNDGTIRTSVDGSTSVALYGDVGSFTNRGSITGGGWGVGLKSVDDFFNSGTISTTGQGPRIGVNLFGNGHANNFFNSGTIEGSGTGVEFNGGVANMVNAGVLRGGTYAFDSNGVHDDKLSLLTGSKIFGLLSFGGGYDTLDFSGFTGNTILDVGGLEEVVPGGNSDNYVDGRGGGAAGRIAIFDISGLGNKAIGQGLGDVAGSIQNLVAGQLGWGLTGQSESIVPLGYVAEKPATGAAAALSDFDTVPTGNIGVWASAIGGGSNDRNPLDQSSLFGGIVAGSHTRVNDMLTLGGLAGYVTSSASMLDGQERLDSQTGLVGLYGKAAMGIIDVDFTLLGGVSGHTSERQIVANWTTETARGTFASVFVAPGVGISIPVLSADATTLLFKGEVSYVSGVTTSYAETGSSMDLQVGSQTISVFNVRVGLEAHHAIVSDGQQTQLVAKAGVLGQANMGSSSVPVTALGQTMETDTAGHSSYGLYGGVGLDKTLSGNLALNIRLDGSVHTDGRVDISGGAGIKGGF